MLRVTEGGRYFHLAGPIIQQALEPASRLELICRLFTAACVDSVLIDPSQQAVRLSFSAENIPYSTKVQQLAQALQARQITPQPFADYDFMPEDFFSRRYEIWRIADNLSLWRMERVKRKEYRLWHPLLKRPEVREQVLDRLSLADVVPLAQWLRPDNSILIHCHSPRLNEPLILETLIEALQELPPEEETTREMVPTELLLHTNLAVAAISEFVFPPLGLANAAMVFLVNKDHWPHVLKGFHQRRANVSMLYLSIGILTVLSFEFFAASAMYWLLHHWPKWTQQLRRKSQRRLLSHYQRVPATAQMERKGQLVEVGLQDLTTNSEIVLRQGDIVPGDGLVTSGTAWIDESWILGLNERTEKSAGDSIYAATRVREGELRMSVQSFGPETQAAKIASWHRSHLALPRSVRESETKGLTEAVALPRPVRESEAKRFADAVTLPVLLLGGLAMLRGGIHMTKAVIRPDYLTGPWMTEELVDLQAMKILAPHGVVVVQPEVLDRISQADCAIFDDSVPWTAGNTGGASITESLRDLGLNEVILLSEQSGKESSRQAKDWGFEQFEADMHSGEKMAFITQRRHLGRKVIYFGDCQRESLVAAQADIAISVAQPPYPEIMGAPVVLLQPDLAKCAHFVMVSMGRTQELQTSLNTTLLPNVAAIAGGLYFGTSVGASVALSNLGNLTNYLRLRASIL